MLNIYVPSIVVDAQRGSISAFGKLVSQYQNLVTSIALVKQAIYNAARTLPNKQLFGFSDFLGRWLVGAASPAF